MAPSQWHTQIARERLDPICHGSQCIFLSILRPLKQNKTLHFGRKPHFALLPLFFGVAVAASSRSRFLADVLGSALAFAFPPVPAGVLAAAALGAWFGAALGFTSFVASLGRKEV